MGVIPAHAYKFHIYQKGRILYKADLYTLGCYLKILHTKVEQNNLIDNSTSNNKMPRQGKHRALIW